MYFQFDREKLTTLMDRWVHHAFRLDPTLKTLSDVDAKYGRRGKEFYGATFDSGVCHREAMDHVAKSAVCGRAIAGLGWMVGLLNTPADISVQMGSLVREAAPAQAGR